MFTKIPSVSSKLGQCLLMFIVIFKREIVICDCQLCLQCYIYIEGPVFIFKDLLFICEHTKPNRTKVYVVL